MCLLVSWTTDVLVNLNHHLPKLRAVWPLPTALSSDCAFDTHSVAPGPPCLGKRAPLWLKMVFFTFGMVKFER